MLIRYKKSSRKKYLESYEKGSYFKIKPNNKKVYSFLEKEFNSKIKNVYNLLDPYGESIGLVCCKLINTEEIGGVQVIFLPLGENGFYDLNNMDIYFDGCFKNIDVDNQNFWHYENGEFPLNDKLKISEILSLDNKKYCVVERIHGKKAAPKIIVKLSEIIRNMYKNDFGIMSAFNPITFDDI